MPNETTPLQSLSAARLNASHSKTYLTRQNYRGPQLLQSIRGQTGPDEYQSIASSTTHKVGMGKHEDADKDICAPPLSSDDDEAGSDRSGRSKGPSSTKRKAERRNVTSLPAKRARGNLRPERASKRKTEDHEPSLRAESAIDVPEFPVFTSQSSQKRKPMATYGRTNTYGRSSSQANSFIDPGDVPLTPRKTERKSFKEPERTPQSRKRSPAARLKNLDTPSSRNKAETVATFTMPDGLDLPISSSTSTEITNVFDIDESPKKGSHQRKSSTSSLSSVDSLASYELSQQQKDELGHGTAPQQPVPAGSIRCPLCQHIVDLSTTSSQTDPTTQSLRKQQTFCHAHRLKDAQHLWQQNKYPSIDWATLEKKRIPKHLAPLRQILYRKTPSFYLANLDSKLAEAKGNQSAIRRYLANEIVELVKPGYYGPKGAKVMGNKITVEMSNHLKRSLNADKTVRAVGVSGFVSAVLLPELLLRLVMEDMKMKDEEVARRIVSESTEVGMLLWPDDDHVVAEDEDAH